MSEARVRRALDWGLVKRLVRAYLGGHARSFVVIGLLMVVVAGTTGLYPLLIDQTVEWLAAKDERAIWLIPLAAIAVTALKGGATYAQNVLTERTVQRVATELQKDMFAHLLRLDYGQIVRAPANTLVSRLVNDIQLIRAALTRSVNNLVRDVLTLISLVGAMLYLDWALSLIVLAIYPVAVLPITAIGRRLRRVSKTTQQEIGDTAAVLLESISGVRLVKTYGLQEAERRRGNAAFERLLELTMRAVRARARLDPTLEVLGGLAVAGVIAAAGWRVVAGGGTVGELTGFISALLLAAQPVRALGTLNAVIQEAMAALERAFGLLDEQPRVVDRPGAAPLAVRGGGITLRDVRFAYGADGRAALDGLTLDAPAGKAVALVGRSGAGKSTVINLVARLFEAESGQVLIDGQDVRDVTLDSLRAAIAVVSQEATLFNETVAANIAYGRPAATRAEIEAAARAAGAHDFIARMPQGYDSPVGERGGMLSGGERQRIALARAFLKDAPILLLDEATSALDAESERVVEEALERLMQGRTTLTIAHRLSTVQRADRIYVLDAGRVAEVGTHAELLAQDGLYAELCRLQLLAPAEPASLAAQNPLDQKV